MSLTPLERLMDAHLHIADAKREAEQLSRSPEGVVHIAYYSTHGLHGERKTCFICNKRAVQLPMVPAKQLRDAQAKLDAVREWANHDDSNGTSSGYGRQVAKKEVAAILDESPTETPEGSE